MALKIAILASGSGTNAQSMIDKAAQGVLDIDIRLIAGNRPGAKVFERAEKAGIPHVCIDHKAFADRESFDREMVAAIKASGAEYVVLAGYMRMLTSTFLQAFPGRVINIHPAILPSFPGAHGGPDAQAYGVKITGCTVHFVEELVDSGPVIIQAAVHGVSIAGAELYCTTFPCAMCSKMLINCGIKHIWYSEHYPDELGLVMLSEAGVTFEQIPFSPDMLKGPQHV